MSEVSTIDLKRRKQPKQARAQQTYDKILLATSELLEEIGFDGINTNLIAETADYGEHDVIMSSWKGFWCKKTTNHMLARAITCAFDLRGRESERLHNVHKL